MLSKVSSTGSPVLDKSIKVGKYKKQVASAGTAGESETDARSSEKEAAKPEESKQVADSARGGSGITYESMIKQVFVDNFNKSKKLRDQGVTYQQIWKEVSEKYSDAKKNILLSRLKKITDGGDEDSKKQEKAKKFGLFTKLEGKNRYKF